MLFVDNKDKMDRIIEGFKKFSPSDEDYEKISRLKAVYENKSEDDIFFEIIEINKDMEKKMSPEEYEKVFEQLESLRPMLNEEQVKKLDRILYILGRE